MQELILKSFPDNENLCIVRNLSKYIQLTTEIRKNETALFVSYVNMVKPYSKVSKDTISRWVKVILSNSGIDINKFKPHSVRSAATSAAKACHIPLSTILRTAGWSNDCVFRKYYAKPVTLDTSFSECILSQYTPM